MSTICLNKVDTVLKSYINGKFKLGIQFPYNAIRLMVFYFNEIEVVK